MIVPTDASFATGQAHAMTPHQAAGASQAIEDAYILGETLNYVFLSRSGAASTPSASLLERALKVYEQVRLPLANSVLVKSRDNGRMYSLSYPGCRAEDLFEAGEDGKPRPRAGKVERMEKILNDQWSWAWTTTIEDDRDKAMRLLDEVLSSHMD
jgi:salicylate hydroxylase